MVRVSVSRSAPVLLILLGASCVIACVWLLCGYAWAIGVLGALALIAGVLLFDPSPNTAIHQTKRGTR